MVYFLSYNFSFILLLLACMYLFDGVSAVKLQDYSNLRMGTKVEAKVYPSNTDTNFFSNRVNITSHQHDWMKGLNDNLYLSEITIPGTHDSAANRFNFTKGKFHWLPINKILTLFRTQSLSIRQQLDIGIRYLDIRVKANGNVYHKYYRTGKTFESVVDHVTKFLENYPSETVIMRIRDESSSDGVKIGEMIRKVIAEYSKFFLKGNKVPTLKEARGKIVPVFEIKNFTNNEYLKWDDKKTMKLQDNFVVFSRISKKKSVVNFQNSNLIKDKNLMYYNHISGTQSFFFIDVEDVAYEVNQVVYDLKGSSLGVLIIDFPSEHLVNYIISKNNK